MVNTTGPMFLLSDSTQTLNVITSLLVVLGLIGNLISLVLKLFLQFVIPPTWKVAIILGDVSNVFLGIGLSLFLSHASNQSLGICNAAGFFILFSILDCLTSGLLSVVILMYIQNPVKISNFSNYSKSLLFILILPPKLLAIGISFLPFIPVDYFDIESDYPVSCFPLRESGAKSSEYGAVVFVLLWSILLVTVIMCIMCAFKLWRSSLGRIHASSPDLWQTQLLGQGKTFQKFLLMEQTIWVITLFLLTLILYTNSTKLLVPQWIVYVALGVGTTLHSIFSHLETGLWSTLCCSTNRKSKEPYQRLKKLELIKVEATSKLRMKASWSLHKGVNKTGMLKVYGVNHVQYWSQEIVILGMLRKCHHPSILQCLWTSTSNPFFETMTLISGQIITSDSRLICMELTNGGCLHQFLRDLDIPLPESCQQTILHDVAEGLSCLHDQNILHNNLNSFSIYLKGSVQCLVLRASVGDFEHASVYGTLQSTGSVSTPVSKKQFFLPDIRAFALVALEILGVVCEKRQEIKSHQNKVELQGIPENGDYFHYERPDSNLSSSIPDSYQLPNQTGVGSSGKGMQKSRGSQDKFLVGNHPIPTKIIVEKYVSDSNMAKSGDYHDDDSVIDSEAVYQTFNSAKNSFLAVPSEETMANPYVNIIGGNKGRPLSARGLPPRPAQPFNASLPRESFHPYENLPPCDGSQSFSASNKSHPGQSSSRPDQQTPRPNSAQATQQYVSGLDPNSAFYRKSEKEREYEEIDEIAECIESDYYRKNMYPTKQQVNKQSYQERPTIPTSGSIQNVAVTSGNALQNGSTIHAPAPPIPPKRNHGPSSRTTVVNQNSASLPGMVDRNSFKGSPSLKDLMSANEAAKIQQHLESYKVRVDEQIRDYELNPDTKSWNQNTKPITKTGQKPEWFHAQVPEPENEIEYVNLPIRQPNNVPIRQPNNVSKQTVVNARPNTAYPSSEIKRSSINRPTGPPPPRPQSANPINQRPPSTSQKAQTTKLPQQNLMKAQVESQTVEISCEYQIPTVRVQSAKATKARSAMKNAIQKNTSVMNFDRGKSNVDIEKKYSKFEQIGTIRDTFRRLKNKRCNAQESPTNSDQTSNVQTNVQHQQNPRLPHATVSANHMQNGSNVNNNEQLEKVSSFSSADSFNSSLYKQHPPKSGESLTSGEVSSLSSQAEMTADQLEQSGYSSDPVVHNKDVVVASAKIVDSGFETASIKSAIGNKAAPCSCDAKGNKPCTCQYASSTKQNSDTKSSWSNTDSISSSLESEATLTANVIPCPDVVPLRRTPTNGPDVLGPDEQYPHKSDSKSDPTKSHKSEENKIFSKMHTTSIMNKKAQKKGVASKKYQELAKRGVPLRVSVVSAKQPSESSDTQTDWSEFDSNYEAEVIEEDPELADAEEVYSDSDAQEFLDSLDSSSSRSSVRAPARIGSFKSGSVVNEVIREVPEESSSTCDDESKGLLRPGEKLVKGFEISSSSASDQPPISGVGREEERKIDRMFTKSLTTNKPNPVNDRGMGLDEKTIRQIVQNPGTERAQALGYRPPVPVRKGLDTHHVKYCQEMASKCNLLEYEDLMPAHVDKFQVLRDKLENEAKLGSVGVQLLDMIQKCWLNDCPPSTGQLVKQLRGPVTETEL